MCFIANSVNLPVRCEARLERAGAQDTSFQMP
jgi:hypothetical protein